LILSIPQRAALFTRGGTGTSSSDFLTLLERTKRKDCELYIKAPKDTAASKRTILKHEQPLNRN